ncbi:unnamed protein product [Cuscuta epithymum]|uniref:F-box domain-containing protein n=1 Tax=Cuscuta epithymum TaxID=186058 RepID=A0AAV0DR27_9ASTE|nr:unnamed protein product [Cuscuta epithymum]
MSDIPSEIHRQILLSLPADSLFRFRSVCKEWCSLIDDPSFVKAHIQNQVSSSTLLLKNEGSGSPPLYLMNFDSLEFTDDLNDDGQMIEAIPVKQLVGLDVPRLECLPENSCNGLILLSTSDLNKNWAVWNPITGDYHQLPPPDYPDYYFVHVAAGIGYDHVCDDYKVVRLETFSLGDDDEEYTCRTLLYSLKLGSWKQIMDSPIDFLGRLKYVNGVCVNGQLHNLHWCVHVGVVLTLDLVTEEYRLTPLDPVPFPKERIDIDLDLDAISGSLILTSSYFTSTGCHFDGWVWQEYIVENPWKKLFSFHLNCSKKPRLVAYTKNKKKVTLQHDDGFFWVDIESNSVKLVKVDGLMGISSQVFPGSLYRLDNRGSASKPVSTSTGVKSKRKQTKKRTITRLKIHIRNEVSGVQNPESSYDSSLGSYKADEY